MWSRLVAIRAGFSDGACNLVQRLEAGLRRRAGEGMPPRFFPGPFPRVGIRAVFPVAVMVALRYCALVDKGSKRPSLHGAIRVTGGRAFGCSLKAGFHGIRSESISSLSYTTAVKSPGRPQRFPRCPLHS